MTPEQLQQIRHVFEYVVGLSSQQRDLVLRKTGEHNPTLVAEVEKLISAYERRDGFIERPIANLHSFVSFDEYEPDLTGVNIGPYHLLHLLGIGGMGEVWHAEQKFPVRRQVAIKLIKAGMDTHEVMARFESERQALALMDHPAIAKVFDAGSTPEGRPYFVMEYVSGVPITTYCDEHKLTTRERLRLFIRVCEGVQHAHQKAIIHRDLKPSNLLITEVDGRPVPKIIDFGVAQAISQQLTAETIFTRAGMILGTPDYMSPEQACSAGEDIDTRTDVHSLGVILYELLVGVLPFYFRKLAFDEILRELRTADAPRPSAKFRSLSLGQQAASSGNRRTEPAALGRRLRGDLDAITLKALEKDRSRRYGSPSELAADIERHLRSEAVAARPANAGYRLQKYIRRHRASVAAAAVLTLLLASFGVAEAVQLRRTIRERDRADRVTKFMTSMYRVSNPSESRGNRITAREILDNAAKEAGTELANDPELQAQMMDVMGTLYYGLGLYPQAESLLNGALQIRRRILGSEHPQTVQSMHSLGNALTKQGRRAEAEKLYRETLAIRLRVNGPDHPDTLKTMNNVAVTLVARGQYAEAEKLHRKILDTRRRVLGPEHPDTLNSLDNLGDTLDYEGRYSEAEQLERESLSIQRRVLGPERPETLRVMHHLANTLYDEGRYNEVEKLDREVLKIRERLLGLDHPDTLNAMVALADTLDEEGHYQEAEQLEREALSIQRRVPGPEHPDTLLAMGNLARFLSNEGKYEEAESLCREVINVRWRVFGPEHRDTLNSMTHLTSILILRGRLHEAEKLSHEVRDTQLRLFGPNHADTAETTYNLACIAAHQGRLTEALSYLRDAVDHGLKPKSALKMEKDPDLRSLLGDARFSTLVAYAHQHATTKPR